MSVARKLQNVKMYWMRYLDDKQQMSKKLGVKDRFGECAQAQN
jgi:hypothetical protein